MRCPFCSNQDTKVVETRENETFAKRRRRECPSCQQRFTTYERLEAPDIQVIKKDGSKQKYSRQKIIVGLEKCFEKRPVNEEAKEAVADYVENYIRTKSVREIPSRKIGSLIMQKVKTLDKIAYLRFASVYKDFKHVDEFANEVAKLSKI